MARRASLAPTSGSPLAALGGRLAEASLGARRDRYESEVVALIDAAHRLTRRRSFDEVTVADILEEAALSTRAFYRHFQSKDELMLAMLEYEIELSLAELAERVAVAAGPEEAFDAWIDWHIAVWFEKRRVRRAALFLHESNRMAFIFPERAAELSSRQDAPLIAILEAGLRSGAFPTTDPEQDAPSIRAVMSSHLRRALGPGAMTPGEVRSRIRRFCLPALTHGPTAPPAAVGERP